MRTAVPRLAVLDPFLLPTSRTALSAGESSHFSGPIRPLDSLGRNIPNTVLRQAVPQKYRRPWLPASGSCDGASTALGGQIDIPVKSPTSPALLIKLHMHVARGHGMGAPAKPGHHDQSARARFIVRTIIKTTCFSPSTIPKTQQKTATNSISPGNESNKKSCHEHGAPPCMLPQEPQPCLARWTEPTDYKHLFSIVPTGRT